MPIIVCVNKMHIDSNCNVVYMRLRSGQARQRGGDGRTGRAAATRAHRPCQQGQWHAPLPLAHRNSIFKSRPQKNGGRLHSAAATRRVYGELIKHASTFFYEFFLGIVNSSYVASTVLHCSKLISCFMCFIFLMWFFVCRSELRVTVFKKSIKPTCRCLYNAAAYLTRNVIITCYKASY